MFYSAERLSNRIELAAFHQIAYFGDLFDRSFVLKAIIEFVKAFWLIFYTRIQGRIVDILQSHGFIYSTKEFNAFAQ